MLPGRVDIDLHVGGVVDDLGRGKHRQAMLLFAALLPCKGLGCDARASEGGVAWLRGKSFVADVDCGTTLIASGVLLVRMPHDRWRLGGSDRLHRRIMIICVMELAHCHVPFCLARQRYVRLGQLNRLTRLNRLIELSRGHAGPHPLPVSRRPIS